MGNGKGLFVDGEEKLDYAHPKRASSF